MTDIVIATESEPISVRTQYLGPEELLVVAAVTVASDLSTSAVVDVINDARGRIREAVPSARVICVEPRVCDPAAST